MMVLLIAVLGQAYWGGEGAVAQPAPEVGVAMLPEEEASEMTAAREAPAEEAGMPPALPAGKGAPVRLLTYNVKNYFVEGEPQRSRYVLRPKPEVERECVAEVIASVEPQVVGLVEIGGVQALADLQARLARRGVELPHAFVLERMGEDRALGILSRWPLVENHSQRDYGLFGNHRQKLLRGILDVTLRTDDGRLFRVMGAHLKSRLAQNAAAAAALREQEAQTVYIYARRRQRLQPNVPLVIFGDWNDTPADPSVQVMVQGDKKAPTTLSRLSPGDSRGEEWTHYFRGGRQYYVFDQLFVNGVLRARIRPRKGCGVVDIPAAERASDHRALWVDLR
ncbi:MAG: endonuclease/exonuclease/phosphatase family protein [Akkermansia sp.]